jgi:hypothetical protein
MAKLNVGDEVRIRDDATTEGKPFGELFLKLTWVLASIDGDLVEITAQQGVTKLVLHTFAHKLRLALPEERSS